MTKEKDELNENIEYHKEKAAAQEAEYWKLKKSVARRERDLLDIKIKIAKAELMPDLKAQRHIDSGKPKPKAHDIVIVETKDQRQAESLCNLFDAINIAIGENEQFDIKINQVGSLVSLSILSGLPDFKVAK